MFALYSPRTYDSIFLANYANTTSTTDDPDQRIAASPCSAPASTPCGLGGPGPVSKLNITIPEILNAINAQNKVIPPARSAPAGAHGQEFTYRSGPGAAPDRGGVRQIVVRANPEGAILRLKTWPGSSWAHRTYNLNGRLNGKPAP